ncbi:uncharacterized protein LOC143449269 [Clavelina lepadiformis]|uniref:uncharacterized protein LOC143449269 n=1 Tax=Clavelina lepadiformis TaxID=159417 RepID=UPI00404229EA
MKFVILLILSFIALVAPHSWIACSDYCEKNGADWDPNCCRGFPRDAQTYAQKDKFGLDRGFDYKPSGTSPGCKTTYKAGSYNNEYPKAIYYWNQQAILAHPMKNHGGDEDCTGRYMPDNGNALYRGKVNTDRDGSFSYYKKFLVTDLGKSPYGPANTRSNKYPKEGYQNAPHFCQDTDKAMGTYSFNVPKITPGEYTFMWRWSFNSAQDIYTTCFDVLVVRSRAERDRMLIQANPSFDLAVGCGGKTSNGDAGSTAGCDVIPTPPPTSPATTPPTVPTTRSTSASTLPANVKYLTTNAYQMTGTIDLGTPAPGISKRFISIHFDCPVQAIFWNARLILRHNHENQRKKRHAAIHHDLLQEKPRDVASGKIYYMVNFDSPCDILANAPIAKLQKEE